MVSTTLWIIAALLLLLPAHGILKAIRHRV